MQRILPVIVISQFFCTSMWFAGNAVLPDIMLHYKLSSDFLATITSMVQLGFISGTLVFALTAATDRYLPSHVFFACAIVAGVCNLVITIENMGITTVLLSRFLTGFFLAGIYPVGMKIAADHFKDGLGRSLGLLVGALVLGTATPHLLKSISFQVHWTYVITATSALAVIGGFCMRYAIPEGPYRKQAQAFRFAAFKTILNTPGLRAAALGYFGHMWELYAFWAFIPVILKIHQLQFPDIPFNISLISFAVIAVGSISCTIAGFLSQIFGTAKIALSALCISGCCCLLSPFFITQSSPIVLIAFLLVWGSSVVADSPLFSTLVAQHAPAEIRGSLITMVTCIGFSITIVSIQSLNYIHDNHYSNYLYMWLAIGPFAGITGYVFSKKKKGSR